MAKARWVKPELFTDEALCAVSERAVLVFEALWTEADDGNVAPGDPVLLYGRCFIKRPQWTAETVEACFVELETAGVIRRGEHRGKRWIYIPHLMEHQGTKPKEWRHLGKVEHSKLVGQIFHEKRKKAPQCAEPPTFTPKPLLEPKPEPVAVAEATSVLRTGLAPAVENPEAPEGPEQAGWDNREAARVIRDLCYKPDGQEPDGVTIGEDLRFWKRAVAGGQTPARIEAALRGLPQLMKVGGKWSPARVFSKRGDWVSLFERAVTEDGKHHRPRALGSIMEQLGTKPLKVSA